MCADCCTNTKKNTIYYGIFFVSCVRFLCYVSQTQTSTSTDPHFLTHPLYTVGCRSRKSQNFRGSRFLKKKTFQTDHAPPHTVDQFRLSDYPENPFGNFDPNINLTSSNFFSSVLLCALGDIKYI